MPPDAPPDVVLDCRDLHKRFGDRVAVDGVGFTIARRRDLRPARAERRRQDHHDLDDLRAPRPRRRHGHRGRRRRSTSGRRDAKAAIGYVPQDLAIYPDLTGARTSPSSPGSTV